jgi:arginine/lysine/ornithine decarboxylase
MEDEPSMPIDFDQQRTPLYDAIVDYAQKNKVSFHTPGHKHGRASPNRSASMWGTRSSAWTSRS